MSSKRKLVDLAALVALGATGLVVRQLHLSGRAYGDSFKYSRLGARLHWPAGKPVPISLHAEAAPGIDDRSDVEAVMAALDTFQRPELPKLGFDLRAWSDGPAPGATHMRWETETWIKGTPAEEPPEFARTVSGWDPETGALQFAEILFNGVDYEWTTTGEPGAVDIQNVDTHELGHLLGLTHDEDQPDATMFSSCWAGATHTRDLHAADLAHLVALYGDGTLDPESLYPPPPPAVGSMGCAHVPGPRLGRPRR